MIIVDHIVKLSRPMEDGRNWVISWAKYLKKNGASPEVIVRHSGKINEIVWRHHFDKLSAWEDWNLKMESARKNDPEAKELLKVLKNNPQMFIDTPERHIWEKIKTD